MSPGAMARLMAGLYLVQSAASVFGQLFISGRLFVRGDPATTAGNILANELLFRSGITASLVSVGLHIVSAVLFYRLFRPVDRYLSLLTALFLVVASVIWTLAALMFSGALVVLNGGTSYGAFGPDQLPALSLVLLDWSDETYNTGLVFFGFWCAAIGYLIYRSTFLPRFLGLGMALAGLGYATFLYPPLASAVYPFNLAIAVGELALLIWLLVAGVNADRWNAMSARRRSVMSSAS
jgi:Domain of unknown function (DUF4386)